MPFALKKTPESIGNGRLNGWPLSPMHSFPYRSSLFMNSLHKSLRILLVLGFVAAHSVRAGEPRVEAYAKEVPILPAVEDRGSWTLVVLPDTQFYSADHPEVFLRQTQWIAANKKGQNIRFVIHEGDVTNNNTPEQWQVAKKAMQILNRAQIPYNLLPGNKDLGLNGKTNERTTLLSDYFHKEDYKNSEAFGLFEEGRLENSWHEVTTPTGKYLIVALEFGPRNEVLDWANVIVESKPDLKVIVVTHGYLYWDGKRLGANPSQRTNPKSYPFAKVGSVNDGEDMWKKIIKKHSNIQIVLNGHCTGLGVARLESVGKDGNGVMQILANYQKGVTPDRGLGGGGYLRLMQFLSDGKTVRVRTYSPWYDRWLTEPDQDFSFVLKETAVGMEF